MDACPQALEVDALALRALHLASLAGDGQPMAPAWQLALAASFGSVERWRDEFIAMGQAPGGGSRWLLLVFQPSEGRLVNQWAADPAQALAGGMPILVLDRHGQAGPLGDGAAAAADVGACMAYIDWSVVYARYQAAVHAASELLAATHADADGALLLDVRRAGVYAQAAGVIPGARWHDPAEIGRWCADLPADRALLVYCVHGHELSQAAALRLHAAGLRARFLQGGIDGWAAAGRPLADKPGV